jgi:hypothetical protein
MFGHWVQTARLPGPCKWLGGRLGARCAVEEPGDRIADQGSVGWVVEVGADKEAVLQRDKEVRGPVRLRVAVRGQQVPQQLAEPASMLSDGLAHGVGGVGILGRGVDEGAASIAGFAASSPTLSKMASTLSRGAAWGSWAAVARCSWLCSFFDPRPFLVVS